MRKNGGIGNCGHVSIAISPKGGEPNLQQKDWSHRHCHERDKAEDETRLSCCIAQETPEAQKGEVVEVRDHVPGEEEAGAGDEDLEAARACHAVGVGEEDEDGQDDEAPLGDEDEAPFPVRDAGEEEGVADDDPRSLLVP